MRTLSNMKPIIEIKGIGKKYNITHQRGGYVALRDVLANIFKNPFKFAHAKAKRFIGLQTKEEFWALRNLNIEIQRGDIVGIIGHNGAGKSTLLKILTRITPPTEGEIIMRGRIASLLEVGTGFHPELTGRENIFLNGAILGMAKKEIAKKFDEIVAFAGIEKFLDTPVKHYSSGMYVRLAFSVAAHMEPDILLVDEVLAVGDAEFQKKCLGKMEEVTKKEGRTILLVSHNMAVIQDLCKKAILLDHGQIKMIGETKDVINAYMHDAPNSVSDNLTDLRLEERNNVHGIKFTSIKITDSNGSSLISSDGRLKISVAYTSTAQQPIFDMRVLITATNRNTGHMVLRLDSHSTAKTLGDHIDPEGEIICETEVANLAEGRYSVEVAFLMQDAGRGHIKAFSEFDVMTDISKYDFRLKPDQNLDYLVKYSFKQAI